MAIAIALVGNWDRPGGLFPKQRLRTGELVHRNLPARTGCGAMSSSKGMLFFRDGDHSMWDLKANTRKRWNGIRPGCWLGVINAGGIVLAPERRIDFLNGESFGALIGREVRVHSGARLHQVIPAPSSMALLGPPSWLQSVTRPARISVICARVSVLMGLVG